MHTDSSTLPRPAVLTLAALSAAAFLVTLLVTATLPAKPLTLAMPVMVVAAIWMVPVAGAVVRGERWAMVLALGMLIAISEVTFRSRSWTDKSLDFQVLMKGAVLAGCGVAGMVRLSATGRLFATAPVLLLCGFLAMIALSTAWSPMPFYTAYGAVSFWLIMLFALAVADTLDERELLLGLAIGSGLIVLPSLAMSPFTMGLVPTSPGSTGEVDRLRGVTDHPIPMAKQSALFLFCCLALVPRSKGAFVKFLLVALAACGLATAWLTQSRIPVLAMVLGVAAYHAYRRGGALLMLPTVLMGFVTVAAMESMAGFASFLPHDLLESIARSGSSKEILTLSGRLVIWPYVIGTIHESPLIGHGFASGMVLFKGFTPWKITHAHNAYLQALLYLGLVGFALMVGVIACQLKQFLVRPQPVRDMLMLATLIEGITEQSMVSNLASTSTLIWMITVGMAAKAWNAKTQNARA